MYFLFVTLLLALSIVGLAVGFAFGCRLPDLPERRRPPRP